jgi:hypothetical protein
VKVECCHVGVYVHAGSSRCVSSGAPLSQLAHLIVDALKATPVYTHNWSVDAWLLICTGAGMSLTSGRCCLCRCRFRQTQQQPDPLAASWLTFWSMPLKPGRVQRHASRAYQPLPTPST